jgi:sugar O-acyltransferase (sialic acid O-acetyltransferase NeuD family)
MNTSLSIIGFGGHGRVLLDTIELLDLKINYLYDEDRVKVDTFYKDIRVTSPIDFDLRENAVIAVGNNIIRKKMSIRASAKVWINIIHPFAIVSKNVYIGEGTVIMAGVVIQTGVKIGKHSIVNTGACIDHDCLLDDFTHVSPNVTLSGGVHVGEGSHIGVGACVIPGIKIGKWVTIGAGTVVISDIPDFATAVGNPARIIKLNKFDE